MTVSTLFNVDSHMQLYADANISTPEIIFFNVVSVNTLREGNQTAASIKPDDEDGWFMFWGVVACAAFFTGLLALQKTYSHCTDLHRQRCSANAHAEHHPEYCLTEETKEEVVNPAGGVGNPFQGHHPV